MISSLPGLIGIIGDVHANDVGLNHAIRSLEELGAKEILCTGDIADGIGSVDDCCTALKAHRIPTVRGNHDRWIVQNQMRDLPFATRPELISQATTAYLTSLPATIPFTTEKGGLLLCHGVGDNDMQFLGPDDYGYALESNSDLQKLIGHGSIHWVIGGHTHTRMFRRFAHLGFINAGTLRTDKDPCYGLLDLDSLVLKFYDITGEQSSHLSSAVDVS